MTVQNDNTILNKGDLKAYHEKILPYLGGNMMVSTNNSDYYSTSEKIVGVWTDGKPLYQKTIIYDLTNKVTSAYYDVIIDNTITALNSYVVSVTGGVMIGNAYKQFNIHPQTNGTNNRSYAIDVINTGVRLTLYESNSSVYSTYTAVIATIQYTKTTDTAGSGVTTPGAYDINFPNTWPANTEIYFGNGLYGKRYTGNTPAVSAGSAASRVIYENVGSNTRLVNIGGWVTCHNPSDAPVVIPVTQPRISPYENRIGHFGWASFYILNSYLFMCVGSDEGDYFTTSDTFDVWATYTK